MGIEEQIDRLIDLGEDIKSRLDLLVKMASDHFADANKMVADEPAKEASLDGLPDIRTFAQPNLRWRILRPDEIVQDGDWMNARVNSQEVGPPDGGWLAAPSFYFGKEASVSFGLYFARPVTEKPRLGSGEAYRLLSKEQLEDFIPFGDFGMGTGLCGTSSIDEPAKEPEHPAGPMPDPGEGYRILSKNPPEDLTPGDEFENGNGEWIRSSNAETTKKQGEICWYRRKTEPAREPEPAWEPKVGDWVRVTRPENWKEWKDPLWREEMHIYDGKVFEFVKWSQWSTGRRASLQGIDWFFHRDWLSPAEAPAKEAEPEHPAGPKPNPGEGYRLLSKEPLEELQPGDQIYSPGLGVWEKSITALAPRQRREPQSFRLWYRRKIEQPKDQYRQPVLPADAGKVCDFSDDGETWRSGYLKGFDYGEHRHQGAGWRRNQNCSSDRAIHRYARIKKDA